jgi:hypothetical protein
MVELAGDLKGRYNVTILNGEDKGRQCSVRVWQMRAVRRLQCGACLPVPCGYHGNVTALVCRCIAVLTSRLFATGIPSLFLYAWPSLRPTHNSVRNARPNPGTNPKVCVLDAASGTVRYDSILGFGASGISWTSSTIGGRMRSRSRLF